MKRNRKAAIASAFPRRAARAVRADGHLLPWDPSGGPLIFAGAALLPPDATELEFFDVTDWF